MCLNTFHNHEQSYNSAAVDDDQMSINANVDEILNANVDEFLLLMLISGRCQ